MNRGLRRVTVGVLCLILAAPLSAQDLDPRAYANIPVNSTFLVSGFAVSHGGVVNDPTLPDLDIDATVETPSLGVGHSFSLFGLTAQAFGALPYSWIQGSARGETRVTRAGVADMRIRLSVLVRGAPATSLSEFAKAPRRTILGTSLTVVAPTGEFFPDKLLNVGTNRWAFKPEIGVSQPIRQRWLLDMYAALWLFGANDWYFPGTTVVTQAPMGAFQVHLSYNFRPQVVDGLRCDVLRRRPGDQARCPRPLHAVQFARRGHHRAAGRAASLRQVGGEPGRHHPVRPRLQHLLLRLADGLGPGGHTHRPVAVLPTKRAPQCPSSVRHPPSRSRLRPAGGLPGRSIDATTGHLLLLLEERNALGQFGRDLEESSGLSGATPPSVAALTACRESVGVPGPKMTRGHAGSLLAS